VNVPFLHYGSITLQTIGEAARSRIEQQSARYARAHYARKWGGPVNQERYRVPFEAGSAAEGVTTPELQEEVRRGQANRRVAAR